ncbi:MAG: hypothetical protein ACO3RB_01450 [Ilumatobacteraceae bacterium]
MSSMLESVKRSLAELASPLTWRRVSLPGLNVPWVGMNVPDIDTGGRPWVWEVVTPSQWDASDAMRDDPMVLPLRQDAVLAEVTHDDHSGPIVRMQVAVRETPEHVLLPRSLDPDGPWGVRLRTGWTVQSLGEAAQCWIDRESPGGPRIVSHEPIPASHDRYQLHPEIDIESGALDRLLTLGPDDAATVTSILAMVHEALDPYR